MIKNYTVFVINSQSQHFQLQLKANDGNGIGGLVIAADKLILEKLGERPEPLHRAIVQNGRTIWSV